MKKIIISENEKKEILNLYFPEVIKEDVDRWVPINKTIQQRITFLDPTKYDNKVVFENMGFIMTIIDKDGDYFILSSYEDVVKNRDEGRLGRFLGVWDKPGYIPVIRAKINLSSSKEYSYKKTLDNKTLSDLSKNIQGNHLGESFVSDFIQKNVSEENVSKIEFRNFPSKPNPLNATIPIGAVTITDWYLNEKKPNEIDQLDLLRVKLSIDQSDDDVSDDNEQNKLYNKTWRKYNRQYKKYKKSQKELEQENSLDLSLTTNLKEALNALRGKIILVDNTIYQINNASIIQKKTITFSCDLQKTNMSIEKQKFTGGNSVFNFKCGSSFLYTNSGYTYKNISYGNNSTKIDKNFMVDIQKYVCKYL